MKTQALDLLKLNGNETFRALARPDRGGSRTRGSKKTLRNLKTGTLKLHVIMS